ncbi:MAG: hypothetical protein WC273_02150 [Dehalococcoidia bacterium]
MISLSIRMPRLAGAHRVLVAGMLALLACALVAPSAALAHERRTVSGYDFVVGFAVEPALEGQMNGLSLRIAKDGKPVANVEKTLKWEVTHVQSKASKAIPLRAVFNTPGSYTGSVMPTLAGQYRFRFTGTIEGQNIDATFESGPGTFNDVESARDVQFPVAAAQPRELEGALRGAADDAKAAADAASAAHVLAIAGVALGALGLAAGTGALALARRGQR